jgi:hypothetical protein
VRVCACGLRSAVCGLQLRSAVCGLRSAVCSLRSAVCGLRSAVCCLRSALCVRAVAFRAVHFARCVSRGRVRVRACLPACVPARVVRVLALVLRYWCPCCAVVVFSLLGCGAKRNACRAAVLDILLLALRALRGCYPITAAEKIVSDRQRAETRPLSPQPDCFASAEDELCEKEDAFPFHLYIPGHNNGNNRSGSWEWAGGWLRITQHVCRYARAPTRVCKGD